MFIYSLCFIYYLLSFHRKEDRVRSTKITWGCWDWFSYQIRFQTNYAPPCCPPLPILSPKSDGRGCGLPCGLESHTSSLRCSAAEARMPPILQRPQCAAFCPRSWAWFSRWSYCLVCKDRNRTVDINCWQIIVWYNKAEHHLLPLQTFLLVPLKIVFSPLFLAKQQRD